MSEPRTRARVTILLFTFAALSLVFLSACQKREKDDLDDFDPNEPVKLKVMYILEETFGQTYGNLLQRKFPNLELEIVAPGLGTFTIDDYLQQINKEQPDVLFLSLPLYEKLADAGRLMELDSVIQQDRFDLSGIYPAVIEQLRVSGNGKLYGLTPELFSHAIYYNADLFRKYGVELPTDRMSWDEVFKLAQRFPSDGNEEERVYGFKKDVTGGLSELVMVVGDTIGLTSASSDGLRLTLQSDGWRKVFESVMKTYQSGNLHIPTGPITFAPETDPFIKGQLAMRLDSFSYYSQMLEGRRKLKISDPFELGVVTAPVNPATPDMTNQFMIGLIFAVNNQTAHKRAAWEVVKYINSEEVAKIHSRTAYLSAPARKEYAKAFEELNIEPFYALKTTATRHSDSRFPHTFARVSLGPLVTNELQLVADGAKSLDEAIETIQTEGQQLLDAYLVKLSSQGDE